MVSAFCLVYSNTIIVNRDTVSRLQLREITRSCYREAMVIYGVHCYYYNSMFKIMFSLSNISSCIL